MVQLSWIVPSHTHVFFVGLLTLIDGTLYWLFHLMAKRTHSTLCRWNRTTDNLYIPPNLSSFFSVLTIQDAFIRTSRPWFRQRIRKSLFHPLLWHLNKSYLILTSSSNSWACSLQRRFYWKFNNFGMNFASIYIICYLHNQHVSGSNLTFVKNHFHHFSTLKIVAVQPSWTSKTNVPTQQK